MVKILKFVKFLTFIYFFSYIFSSISQTNEEVPLNNIIQHKNPKVISSVVFEDFLDNEVNLNNYHGKLIVINFWATWCAPCKKEMPSLDELSQNDDFDNLVVLPINIEKPNTKKTQKFFKNLEIKKLSIFFDKNSNFAKEFKLKGVPTTILINKKGKEFARIKGSIDFQDKSFLEWLLNYD